MRVPRARLGRMIVALVAGLPIGCGSAAADQPLPEEDYVLNCSGCHGPDGDGTRGVVPSLEDLGAIAALPGGRQYLARVPGVAQAPLSGGRLARLLNWLVERHAGAPPDPLYGAEEVTRLRRMPLRNASDVRRELDSRRAR